MNKTQYYDYLQNELTIRHKGRISVASSSAIVFAFLSWGPNFMVCFCVIKNKKLHSLTNFFLVFLAVADLAWEICVMPLWIDVLATGKMRFSQKGCNFSGFTTVFFHIGKLLTIYTISVNRICNIYCPAVYGKMYCKWPSVAMVIATWCLTIILTVVITTASSASYEFHPGRGMCLLTFNDVMKMRYLVVTMFVFCAVLPLCMNIICHIKAYHELKEHKRETRGKIRIQTFAIPEMVQEEHATTTDKEEIRSTRTLLGVIYSFSLCNLLTTSIIMADVFRPYFLDRGTHLALTFFTFVNSILNPLILARTNSAFREVVVVMLGCKWTRRVIHVQ